MKKSRDIYTGKSYEKMEDLSGALTYAVTGPQQAATSTFIRMDII